MDNRENKKFKAIKNNKKVLIMTALGVSVFTIPMVAQNTVFLEQASAQVRESLFGDAQVDPTTYAVPQINLNVESISLAQGDALPIWVDYIDSVYATDETPLDVAGVVVDDTSIDGDDDGYVDESLADGSYTVTYSITEGDLVGNAQLTVNVSGGGEVLDAPQIILNTASISLAQGDALPVWTDYIASVTGIDGGSLDIADVVVDATNVDSDSDGYVDEELVDGSYVVTYSITEAAHPLKPGTATLTVNVGSSYVYEAPQITLNQEDIALSSGDLVPDWTDYITKVEAMDGSELDASLVTVDDSTVDSDNDGYVDELVSRADKNVIFTVIDPTTLIPGSATLNVSVSEATGDTEAPVITLKESQIEVRQGDAISTLEWKFYINTITDNIDTGLTKADVTVETSTVDTDSDGIIDVNPALVPYDVTYSVTDTAGNTGSAVLKVKVLAPDTEVPVITLNQTDITVSNGTTVNWLDYVDNVSDNVDTTLTSSDIVVNSTAVDADQDGSVDVEGTNQVIYKVTDAAGNEGTATLNVTVKAAADGILFTKEVTGGTGTDGKAKEGDLLHYSYKIENDGFGGGTTLEGVVLTDLLDDTDLDVSSLDNLAVVDSLNAPVTTLGNIQTGLQVGDIESGDYVVVSFDVNAVSSFDTSAEIESQGVVTATNYTGIFSSPKEVVEEAVDIEKEFGETAYDGIVFEKEVTGGTGTDGKAKEGDTLTYTYTIENDSFGSSIQGVILTDLLDDVDLDTSSLSNLTVVDSTNAPVTPSGDIQSGLGVGDIAEESSVTVSFTVNAASTFDTTADIDSKASVTATNYVDGDGNLKMIEENEVDLYKENALIDTEVPVISLSSGSAVVHPGDTMTKEDWQAYVTSVTDNVDTLAIGDVEVDDSAIDTDGDDVVDAPAGTYTVTYSIEDAASNMGTNELTVYVVDSIDGILFTKEVIGGTGTNGKAKEGDTLHYTYTVKNTGFNGGTDLEGVIIQDALDDVDLDTESITNVEVIDGDGNSATHSGDIQSGMDVGVIPVGESRTVSFDINAAATFDTSAEIDSQGIVSASNYTKIFGKSKSLGENQIDIQKDLVPTSDMAPVINLSMNQKIVTYGDIIDVNEWKSYIISIDDDNDTLTADDVTIDFSAIDTNSDGTVGASAGTYAVTYTVEDSAGNTGSATIETTVIEAVDGILFTKEVTGGTGANGKAKEGDTLHYTYTVENTGFNGGTDLEGVVIQDALDDADLDTESIINIEVLDENGDLAIHAGDIQSGMHVGVISVGESRTITFDVNTVATFDASAEIDSQGTVTASNYTGVLGGQKTLGENIIDIQKDTGSSSLGETPEIVLTDTVLNTSFGATIEWKDFIGSVTDDVDTLTADDVLVDASQVDTDSDGLIDVSPGSYEVTYSVTDSDGNTGSAVLDVNVVSAYEGVSFSKQVTGGTGTDGKVKEGDLLHYTYTISNESFSESVFEGAILTDALDDVDVDNTTVANLVIDGTEASGDVTTGLTLGDISLGENVVVEFDVNAANAFDSSTDIDSQAKVTATNYSGEIVENTTDALKEMDSVLGEEPVINLSTSFITVTKNSIMTETDWLNFVSSVDDDIDSLTVSDVIVDSTEVDTDSDDVIDADSGNYTVTYSVTDSDGNVGSAILNVTVAEEVDGILFIKEVTGGTGTNAKAKEGDSLHYKYTVTNSSFGSDLVNVTLTDALDDTDLDNTSVTNLKVDGVDVSGDVITGLVLGDIAETTSVVVEFDVNAASAFDETEAIDSVAKITADNYTGVLGIEKELTESSVDILKDISPSVSDSPVIELSETVLNTSPNTIIDWKSFIVSVTDDVDTLTADDVLVDSSQVDTNGDGIIDVSSGTYKVTYSVTDSDGNVGTAELVVNVGEVVDGILFMKTVTGGTSEESKAKEGDLLHYEYKVENFMYPEDLEDVVVVDPLDDVDLDSSSVDNLKIDGEAASGDITSGISLGIIAQGDSKTLEFDVNAASTFDETEAIDSQAYLEAGNYKGILRTNSLAEDIIDIYKDVNSYSEEVPEIVLAHDELSVYENTTGIDATLRSNIERVDDDVDSLTADDVEIDKSVIDTDNDDVVDAVPGDYTISYTVEDSSGNSAIEYATVKVVDEDYVNEAPSIELTQLSDVFKVGDAEPDWTTYVLGVEDDLDTLDSSDVLYDATDVDMNTVGTYTVHYTVEDTLGATSSADLSVFVTEDGENSEIPVIKLYDNEITMEVGDTEPNWAENIKSISDDKDNLEESDVNIDSSSVNMNAVGTYYVKYTVKDSDSNEGTATLKVNVTSTGTDSTAPVIDLYVDEINMYVGESKPNWLNYVRNVSDDQDELDESDLKIDDSAVNTSKVGIYPVVYSVTDSDNNTTVENLYVYVLEDDSNTTDTDNTLTNTATTSFTVIVTLLVIGLGFVGIDLNKNKNK